MSGIQSIIWTCFKYKQRYQKHAYHWTISEQMETYWLYWYKKGYRKDQRKKISYIKNNCLKYKGLSLSLQTIFDNTQIETNKQDLIGIDSQISYTEGELRARKKQ